VALSILQGSVYLVPIITTPYLARVLEVENFGLLEVASAIVGYVSLVSDWGFGYTATRDVATRRRSGGTPIGSFGIRFSRRPCSAAARSPSF
jgi:O-antigen/teichoic acid export membrane protein